MKKVVITVVSITFLCFIIFLILGSLFTDKFVDEEINKINNSEEKSKSLSEIDSLENQSLLLRKYFKNVITDSNAAPSVVKINLTGKLKTGENSGWQEVTAEQYYSIAKPGYVWNAKLKMNEFVWARAVESYVNGKGNILIKLFSSLKISDAFGGPVDQSGLTRYLCEAVFFPNVLLPGQNIEWEFIEQGKVKAIIRDNLLKVEAVFYFDSFGQITKIETLDRYRTIKTGYRKTLFSITFSGYKNFDGFIIPAAFETHWHTKEGTFTFGKFKVTGAEYN